MKLYTTKMAPNPDRVTFFLKAKNTHEAIEHKEVSIMKGEHLQPEYRTISPLAQIPALELDDGSVITESRAICTYLEGAYPEPNLMGNDHHERAVIEMWDRRVEMLFFMSIAQWFRHSNPMMAPLEKPQCPDWAASNEARAAKLAKFFDDRLASSPYIAGERFTIADITAFVAVQFGRVVKFAPWEANANLARWRDEMLEYPCFQS